MALSFMVKSIRGLMLIEAGVPTAAILANSPQAGYYRLQSLQVEGVSNILTFVTFGLVISVDIQ